MNKLRPRIRCLVGRQWDSIQAIQLLLQLFTTLSKRLCSEMCSPVLGQHISTSADKMGNTFLSTMGWVLVGLRKPRFSNSNAGSWRERWRERWREWRGEKGGMMHGDQVSVVYFILRSMVCFWRQVDPGSVLGSITCIFCGPGLVS